ncbi:MAG: histidinol dehydrogenase [Bacteroidota bacterium]
MKRFNQPQISEWGMLTQRPTLDYSRHHDLVQAVFNAVRTNGDAALKAYALEFDHANLETLELSRDNMDRAAAALSDPLKQAIQQAATNIRAFHSAQRTEPVWVETQTGVKCWQKKMPIEKVGIYIPGGTAPLFSTVLMLAIPAQLAGCTEVVLCTPQQSERQIAPEILYAAGLCGVSSIHPIGGIQAIAAMALGTETVSKVDKIFGPGNQYVTAAKQYASQSHVAIDMPAGPSELLVFADDTAIPEFVAADLLSQAEHGSDSQVVLVSTSSFIADAVEAALSEQLSRLNRKKFAEDALSNSRIVIFDSEQIAADFINTYAPEHYIIASDRPDFMLAAVKNAGSVFVGNYTPESAGDYASGTNHTLPTNGFARQYSGVNLDSYLKAITFQQISPRGIQALGRHVELMARAEGLMAHENAVTIRLAHLQGKSFEPETFDVDQRIRPHLKNAQPYRSARDEFDQDEQGYTWLDANENPFETDCNRYPDPYQSALKSRISALWKLPTTHLFIGNGSDEVLELVFQLFCSPRKNNVVAIDPSYGMYKVLADKYDVAYRAVPLDQDFELDRTALLNAVDPMTAMVLLCSPNNPTGNNLNFSTMKALAHELSTLLVVDEAYIDFSDQPSMISLISECPNVMVVRTLSKAYGLAGARLGIGAGSPRLIQWLNRIKPPYNVNSMSQQRALERLSSPSLIKEEIDQLNQERTRLFEALRATSWVKKVFPSQANFILIRVDDAGRRYQQLVDQRFVVRNRSSQYLCENTLRITVGTPKENERLIQLLNEKK